MLCIAIIAKVWQLHETSRRMFFPDSFPEPLVMRRHDMARGSGDENTPISFPEPFFLLVSSENANFGQSKAGNGQSPCTWC